MSIEQHILHELTPLKEKDALYIADRHKKEFTYPIHCHDVYELNFVEGATGVKRIVGDSEETIEDLDLVLITSGELEHMWEQGSCKSDDIREITIQFKFGMDPNDHFFSKTPFNKIREMLNSARKGVVFSRRAIHGVYDKLNTLSQVSDHFEALLQFLDILNDLSNDQNMRTLATCSYAKVEVSDDKQQILKVKNYIAENFMYEIRLEEASSIASMSKSSFSRFFKLHTGRTFSDYVTDVRMGHAARLLIDSEDTISAISFNVGYNNLSNFNRIFRRLKGCTPSEFRENYRKKCIIV